MIRRTVFALLLLALAAFVMRAHLIDVPLERDEGEYAYIAQRLSSGDVPYRDIFDQKPPGIFLVYWVAFRLGPETVRTIHLSALLAVIFSAWSLYFVMRRLGEPISAFAGGLFLIYLTSDPHINGFSANTELFMNLPIIASVACLLAVVRGHAGLAAVVACGILNGIAFLFKPVAVFNMVLCAAVILLGQRDHDETIISRIRRVSLLFAGFLSPILASFVVFAALGAASAYFQAVFINNFYYVEAFPGIKTLLRKGPLLAQLSRSEGLAWLFGAIALAVGIYKHDRTILFFLLWFVSACIGISVGQRYYPHYFVQWVPPLSALAGAGLGMVMSALAGRLPSLRFGVSAVLLLLVGSILVSQIVPWARLRPEEISKKVYGANPFVEAPAIAEYLSERTTSDDSVFVIGSEPEILFYSRRKSASRYIYTYPIFSFAGDSEHHLNEYIQDFHREQPRVVLLMDITSSLSEWTVMWWPRLEAVLNRVRTEYDLVAAVPISLHWSPPLFLMNDEDLRFVKGSAPAVYIFIKRETSS